MEEVNYMVCERVDELETPVEGSTTTACVECGHDIWISAESRKQLNRVGAMPLCSRCAVRVAKESETEVSIGAISDGQVEEVMKFMREKHPELMDIIDDSGADNFEVMKATASAAALQLRHVDDDLGAIVVMEDYDGITFPPIPLSDMLRTGIPKEIIAKKLLPALVQASTAKRVLIGMSTWKVTSKELPTGPISEHPDRTEALIILDLDADGVQRMSEAEIIRDGVSPPRLGEWHDSEKPSSFDGEFVDALVPTLQLVRTLRSS